MEKNYNSRQPSRSWSDKYQFKLSYKLLGTLIFFLTLGLSSNAQTYCIPSSSSTGDHTSAFTTSGAVTNLSYTASTNAPSGYSDQTAQVLTSYGTQVVNFSHTYVGGSQGLAIWVDWNNDFDFADVGEQIFTQSASGAAMTGSITIPLAAPAGTYRM